MSEVILTSQNFEEEVIKSNIPVLVDFYADWCGPCKMIAPIVSEIANEYAGKVKVGKVNVDDSRNIAMDYKIVSIPTLMIFNNGEVVNKLVGFHSKSELIQLLNL